MAEIENAEHPYPRPLSGAKVGHLPSALVPARTPLIGRSVTLEPLDAARHAGDLFEASHGSEAELRIWYLSRINIVFASVGNSARHWRMASAPALTRPKRSAIPLRQNHSCSFDHLVGA